MGLSLEKKSELVRLSLAKRNVPTDIKVQVKLAMDVSGSTQDMFNDGTMQELTDRLIPVGMRFDDNGAIETYAFSDSVKQISDITAADFGRVVEKIKREAARVMWGGTVYSEALKAILDDINPSGTLRSVIFGRKPIQPSYIKFITDGDNDRSDNAGAELLLEKLGQFKCYVQLVGIGRGSSFSQLKAWANEYPHVGFVTFPDLANTSDQAMYETLLSDEFCNWLKQQ